MKNAVIIFGLVVLWVSTAMLFGLLIYSWSSPIGEFTATTNTMHERWVEVILLGIALIIGVFIIGQYVKKEAYKGMVNLTPTGTTVEIRVGEEGWIVGFAYEEDDQSGITVNPNHEIILECCGKPESECDCEQR